MNKRVCLLISFCILIGIGFAKCINGNCKNGRGTFVHEDGTKYSGQFKDGKYHGKGRLIYPNGERYVGQFFL